MAATSTMQTETQAETGAAVIVVRGVHKHYGPIHAVDGVDLDIRAGELFGLIGHNGAGKSTMFKMMLGLIPTTAGEIRIGGAQVSGGNFRAVRRTIGYLPENVVLYDNLTGLETLHFFSRLKGVSPAENGAALEKAGALVGFHTDDYITDSRLFLRSAGLAVRAGMSREKALYGMTMAGAKMLELNSRTGSLETGKDADFIVLSGDPLSVYTHVMQTWVEGKKVFDRSDAKDYLIAVGGYGASSDRNVHIDCFDGDVGGQN